VGGITSGYIFSWYNGSTIKAIPDFQGSTYQGLTNSTYTVTATHNISKCVSDPVVVTIDDLRPLPNISFSSTPNTNCLNNNGSLTVSVGGNTAAYTFEWYTGSLPLTGPPLNETSNSLTGRPGGSYSVKVTHTASSCESLASFSIAENSNIPIVTFEKSDLSNCSPRNSSITVEDIIEGGESRLLSNYNLILYNANGVTPSGYSGNPFSDLPTGKYFLEVENKNTGCRSVKSEININDVSALPQVTS
jgi:hypothetical protein